MKVTETFCDMCGEKINHGRCVDINEPSVVSIKVREGVSFAELSDICDECSDKMFNEFKNLKRYAG